MKFIAIVPAYNEEKNIFPLVLEIKQYITNVIVINDGSSDKTGTCASAAGAYVLDNSQCMGLGYTLQRGFHWALDNGYDACVCLDGDGAHSPRYIPIFLETIASTHADIVLGSRFLPGSNIETMPTTKVLANKIASAILKVLGNIVISDPMSGFKALGHRALEYSYHADDFSFASEISLISKKNGWQINEIPIEVRYDARSLLVTQQLELYEFMAAASRISSGQLAQELMKVMKKVDCYESFSTEIEEENTSYLIIAHPISGENGYIFQLQHLFYNQIENRPIDLRLMIK